MVQTFVDWFKNWLQRFCRSTKETVMVQVVIDAGMQSKFHNFSQPIELCDPSGRVLGQFIPANCPRDNPFVPQVSEEELDRREHANEARYSTAEVLARLEKV